MPTTLIRLFLHYEWFLQNLVKDFIRTILHTTLSKVKNMLNDSLDSIQSPSVKIQIMVMKVCLRCKGKTLLGIVNKLLKPKILLTSPSNVVPYY